MKKKLVELGEFTTLDDQAEFSRLDETYETVLSWMYIVMPRSMVSGAKRSSRSSSADASQIGAVSRLMERKTLSLLRKRWILLVQRRRVRRPGQSLLKWSPPR